MISVLYVDDEPGLLQICKLFLEETRLFTVDIVTSASAALMRISTSRYDAIVSDYQMPEMNGIGFLKAVRKQYGEIPFILFTGRGREEVVIEAINNGADFYLQKGGDPQSQFAELANMIGKAVRTKQTERSLRDSERRFADIIDFLPDATFVIDRSGHVIAWNRAIEEMTGARAEDMLGKGKYEYAIPFYGYRRQLLIDQIDEPDDKIAQFYSGIRRSGNSLIAETSHAHPKGQPIDVFIKVCPLYNQKGAITGAIETIRDITEQKKNEVDLSRKNEELNASFQQIAAAEGAVRQNLDDLKIQEAALRMSEERYRNVVEDQTEFISRFLPDGTHVFVNEAYCRYFAMKRDELLGHRFRPVVPDPDKQRLSQFFQSLTRDHPVGVIEHRIIMPSGEVRWQRWSDRAIFSPEGEIVEIQSVGRDITLNKQAEEALNQAHNKLRLFYSITRHDITNQLTLLRAHCALLGKRHPDIASSEDFRNIVTAAGQISAMIQFTKTYEEVGITSPVWQNCHSLVDVEAAQVPPGTVTVLNELPPDDEVLADAMVSKVFYNLMENAVRHGGKITTIRFFTENSEGDHRMICEDDGDGIPAGDKERIFEKGFGKNTGLGLFLAREILSITGIAIAETGEPGRGARFEMTVPREAYRSAATRKIPS